MSAPKDMYFQGIHPETKQPALFLKKVDGRIYHVKDAKEYEKQHDQNSHVNFFERQKELDPHWEYKRKMRARAIAQEVEETVMSRVIVNNRAGTNVKTVSDHTFLTELQQDPAFIPLREYHDKLKTYKTIKGVRRWTGGWIRPVLSGEVGMIGDQILILEEAYTPGVQVKEQLTQGEEHGSRTSRPEPSPNGGSGSQSSAGSEGGTG